WQKENIEEIYFLPLYPQYALSSTESGLREFQRVLKKLNWSPKVFHLPDFFADQGFVSAFASRIYDQIKEFKPDHILFSYHGLPVHQVQKAVRANYPCYQKEGCCEAINKANSRCYRA